MVIESGGGANAAEAVARFSIPQDVTARVARMLTPGSSIVVTDRGLGQDTTPHGSDFIVVTNRRN